jgi:hypothetical protein
MRIKFSIGLTILACLMGDGLSASKPNFSGTWIMDQSKSFSNPSGLNQTLIVVQNGDEIKLEARLSTPQGEQTISESYKLDDREMEFTPPGATPGTKGKRRASWLPDQRGIMVADEITRESPSGPVVERTVRKWRLAADGLTLTIDYYIDTPKMSYESKRVFVKKS